MAYFPDPPKSQRYNICQEVIMMKFIKDWYKKKIDEIEKKNPTPKYLSGKNNSTPT